MMLLAIRYCKENNIEFILSSKNAGFTLKEGWKDYFKPFCQESNTILDKYFNFRNVKTCSYRSLKNINLIKWHLKHDLKNLFILFLRGFGYKTLHTQDVWEKLFTYYNHDNSALKRRDTFYKDLIKQIFVYNERIEEQIKNTIEGLQLPSEYISCQIRDGDKDTEFPLLSVKQYIEQFEKKTSCKNIFILTDNYDIFLECQQTYPEYNWYTLCNEEEKGYYHQIFKKENTERKQQQYINLLSSIEIFAHSTFFFGTLTANPGLFMALRCPEKFIIVDGSPIQTPQLEIITP